MVSEHAIKGWLPTPAAVLLAFISATFAGEAAAQLLYCCEIKGSENKGKKICGDSLPNSCVGHPYTIRGPSGRLVRSVDGYLTPEQAKAKEEQEKRKKEEEMRRKEQARLDAALLATYSSEADLQKGRERMEAEFAASIQAAEGRVAAAEARKKKAIGDPEFYKKRGMPEDLKRQVQDIDFEIRSHRELIVGKNKDLEAARTKFDDDRKRFADLKKRQGVRP